MGAFENSPEALAIKEMLREFFMNILHGIGGAFLGFYEWVQEVHLRMPPMLKIFGNTTFNLALVTALIAYVVLINLKTFSLFKHDKEYAQDEEERIPEFRLLLNVWIGGAIGGFFAMRKFRHKTTKARFYLASKILIFVQLLIISFLLGFLGFWTFI